MDTQFPDCRSVLAWEFHRRRQRNFRYSLRAYARDLAVSPSYLCEVMAGKYHLSLARADEIAPHLRLDEALRSVFVALAARDDQRYDRAS